MATPLLHPIGDSERSSGSMGTRINRYSGRVEVRHENRNWVAKLQQDFAKLDDETQRVITEIIRQIGQLNPAKAVEVGRWLEGYFQGLTKAGNPQSLIEELQRGLAEERAKKIQ